MSVGIEFFSKQDIGLTTLIIDLVILRIQIQHGNPEDFEDEE